MKNRAPILRSEKINKQNVIRVIFDDGVAPEVVMIQLRDECRLFAADSWCAPDLHFRATSWDDDVGGKSGE